MGEGVQDISTFNLVSFATLLVLAYLTWSLPRRSAVCPLLVMTCLMPLGQRFVLLGLHFYLFRVLLFVGVLRVLLRGEAKRFVFTSMDKIFAAWVAVAVVFGTMADPSMDRLVNRLGDAYNAVGCFFFVRCVLVDFEDIESALRTLAILSVPVAGVMLWEKMTGHNLFSIFGGVPAVTEIRGDHLRCQGAFRHPILAGTFGASQLPCFVALWFVQRKGRRVAIAAIFAALAIVASSSSSGALMAMMAGLVGLFLWRWRHCMGRIRWAVLVGILFLAVVMEAPVWYLFDRLSRVIGGTGWHRAYLIDQTIAHFDEWWLFGTTHTAHWGPSGEVTSADPDMMDITNHYIIQGVSGGLLKLVLFVALIVRAFKTIKEGLNRSHLSTRAILVWCLGVSLFVHCVSFLSTTYFDQIVVVWYWLLAAICCLEQMPIKKIVEREQRIDDASLHEAMA